MKKVLKFNGFYFSSMEMALTFAFPPPPNGEQCLNWGSHSFSLS